MKFNRRHITSGLSAAAFSACAPKSKTKPHSGDAEIIVLGAGLAGLHAARLLSAAGKNVLILEATDRVGGRVQTCNHGNYYTEAGGARIRVGDNRLRKIIYDLALELEPSHAGYEEIAYWLDGRPVDISTWVKSRPANTPRPFSPSVSDKLIKGGAQKLPEAMANELPRSPILRTYVKAISTSVDGVAATDHTGRIWRSKHLICSLPFGALRYLRIKADTSELQKSTINQLLYTQNLQVHFKAKSAFWETDKLPADMRSDGMIRQVIASRDQSGRPTGLFVCHLSGLKLFPHPRAGDAGLHQSLRSELSRLRPSTYAHIEIFDVVRWTTENRAAGGAYIFDRPDQNADWVERIGHPAGRLHFAGSHLGIYANGMEGALESAERTVASILN